MSKVEIQGEKNADFKISQILDALNKFQERRNDLEAFLNGSQMPEPTSLEKYKSVIQKVEEMKSLLMILESLEYPCVSRNDSDGMKEYCREVTKPEKGVSNLLDSYSTLENTLIQIKKHFSELEEKRTICQSNESFVDVYEKIIQNLITNSEETFSNIIAHLQNLLTTESKGVFQRDQLEDSENEKGLNRNLTELINLDECETADFKLLSNVEVCLCDKTCQKRIYEIVLPMDGKVISEELWIIFMPTSTCDKTLKVHDIIIKNNDLPISDLKERNYTEATLPRLFAELKSRLYLQKA